jgi:hypothetical protein
MGEEVNTQEHGDGNIGTSKVSKKLSWMSWVRKDPIQQYTSGIASLCSITSVFYRVSLNTVRINQPKKAFFSGSFLRHEISYIFRHREQWSL